MTHLLPQCDLYGREVRSVGKCDVISRGSWPWRLRQSGTDPQTERTREHHFRGWAVPWINLYGRRYCLWKKKKKNTKGGLTLAKVDIYA